MKITCHACDAKYTIADEKVTGRTVKIKCKKCGATIVVAADQAGAAAAPGAPAYGEPQQQGAGDDDGLMATRVAGHDGAPGSPSAPEWTVSLGEQEQQMSQLQIAEEMQRGTITGDTYVWRDGMPDWLAVSQVPELAALLARAAPAAPAPVHGPGAVQDEPGFGLAGTMIMTDTSAISPHAAPRPAAGLPAPPAPEPAAALAPVNQPTAAARRANRTGGPSVDVFQAAAENQPREPEKQRPKPPTPAGRLGERNENSVLFSLSALTATENAAKSSKPDDAVVDLGLGGGSRNGKGSAVDDLMNIGGGAIGGPMLAPPPLLAPVVEPPPAPAPVAVAAAPAAMGAPVSYAQPAPQPKGKTGLIVGIVAAVVVIGGVGAAVALSGGSDSGSGVDATNVATTSAAPATTPAPSPASADPAPSTTDPAAGTTSAPASSNAAVASNDSKTPSSGSGAGPGSATSTKAGATPSATASTKPSAAPSATASTAPTATDTGGGGRDFNKGAATTALSAAAGRARGCKQPDGPTGSASVRVVFAPSGNVTSANVQGPPFAGTPVGGCIAAAFRGASVPPFDGSPVAVTKTVNIN